MMSQEEERRLVIMSSSRYPAARQCRYCHGPDAGPGVSRTAEAFTIIEILIVVVILAIAAMTALPMFTSAASVQVRSAANMIASDLEYAKSLAISKAQNFSVVFDQGADSYRIEDQAGNIIAHPVKKGFDYVIDFQDVGLDRVDVTGADFNGASSVTFDFLGSPNDGGDITIQGGTITMTISVEPVTGYISIAN